MSYETRVTQRDRDELPRMAYKAPSQHFRWNSWLLVGLLTICATKQTRQLRRLPVVSPLSQVSRVAGSQLPAMPIFNGQKKLLDSRFITSPRSTKMRITHNWLYIQYLDVVAYTPPSVVRAQPPEDNERAVDWAVVRAILGTKNCFLRRSTEAKHLESMASQRDIFVTFASAFLAFASVNSRPVESQPDEGRDAGAPCEQRTVISCCCKMLLNTLRSNDLPYPTFEISNCIDPCTVAVVFCCSWDMIMCLADD
jgi:hypothetical protein